MKLCNETITVFNKRLNSDKGWNEYVPSTIQGVSWYGEIASVVDDKGLHAADRFTIRIPTDADFGGKEYADPVEFAKLPDVSGYWTIANGDVMAKGAVEEQPFATETSEAITDEGGDPLNEVLTLEQIHARYTNCCTVLGVTDNRRAPNAPHWKVVGS